MAKPIIISDLEALQSEVDEIDTALSDIVTVAAPNKILKLDANSKLPASITGSADGNAATATKLATSRTITATGDATSTAVSFDGSANISIPLTLANSGATAGTYKSVTVDAKGRVTSGTNPTTLSGYGITDAIKTSDFTVSKAQNGYIKMPNGIIIQWGVAVDVPTGSTATTVTLPIAFPTLLCSAIGVINGGALGTDNVITGVEINLLSLTQIQLVHTFGSNRNVSWIAIGY